MRVTGTQVLPPLYIELELSCHGFWEKAQGGDQFPDPPGLSFVFSEGAKLSVCPCTLGSVRSWELLQAKHLLCIQETQVCLHTQKGPLSISRLPRRDTVRLEPGSVSSQLSALSCGWVGGQRFPFCRMCSWVSLALLKGYIWLMLGVFWDGVPQTPSMGFHGLSMERLGR